MNVVIKRGSHWWVRFSPDLALETVEQYGPFLSESEAEDFADELESLETPLQRRERWEERQGKP